MAKVYKIEAGEVDRRRKAEAIREAIDKDSAEAMRKVIREMGIEATFIDDDGNKTVRPLFETEEE